MLRLFTVFLSIAGTVAADDGSKQAPKQLLTIHYHRFDGDYDKPSLWTWDEQLKRTPQNKELFPVGRDDFGVIFKLDPSKYGRRNDRIGFLPRLKQNWDFKDSPDRYWSPEMGYEVYLVEGRNQVYTSPPDVRPKLLSATLDRPNTITLHFTHSMKAMPADEITLRDQTGSVRTIAAVTPVNARRGKKARCFKIRTAKPLELFEHDYEVEVRGFATRRVRLGQVLTSKQFHDPDAQMGATYTPVATTFRVFSPMADAVEVVISQARTGGQNNAAYPMTRNKHGVWSATIEGDLKNQYYAYKLRGPDLDPNREVTDVSAVCAQGLDGWAVIVDLDATDPPGFDPSAYVKLPNHTDAVLYEMHVRDFSIAANSGIEHKGKYLGLAETGTHLPGDPGIKTGLDHLVELGITHVHLLPVQDFENNESRDQYNWGYVTMFFNTPEGWFATTPEGDARIREFKQAVQAFHEHGIGVVMDVVYNHTASRATFELTAPGYYFRMRPDGSFWNGSGCGNEMASENSMVRKFIVDSLVYWATEYGIDGFRFDLMGLTDLATLKLIRDRLREINPSVLLYGEPWTGGQSGIKHITDKNAIRGSGIAAFNDHLRDGIKGDRNGGAPGFVQTGDRVDRIRSGIEGAIHDWAISPTDVISYCACHDNLSTWDKIVQSAPWASLEMKKRMQRFAGLLVLTAQGMPFLHAGQELCRSKGGDHNSYSAPDEVNRIDWSWKKANNDVFTYYQGLIALRKAHPVFRLHSRSEVERRLRFLRNAPARRCLAYTIDGRKLSGETCSTILVLLNGERRDQTFTLPPGSWKVSADADRAGVEPLYDAARKVKVSAHSGMILCR
ncbi:MAG: type I pullulanase [Phycisphaerae bacterium]|nr:type I pullulanase [Phycisphaerae bacterium]